MSKQPDVEHLASLKSYLEKRLSDLESKVALYRGFIRAIDDVLAQSSFKVAADLLKESHVKSEEGQIVGEATKEKVGAHKVQLASRADGTKLGDMVISETSVTVTPTKNVRCTVDSGTFNTFFIKKILGKMIEKDEELINLGEISETEKISYRLTKNNDGTLKEIVISNYRDENRLGDITKTIRWTLENVLQKSPKARKEE